MANLKGGLTGAATGAAAGSVFGPWGTAIGGGLGGLAGLFGGAFGGDTDESKGMEEAMARIQDRYAQYRPEDMARRQEALKNAMSLFEPSMQSVSAMGGGKPMVDWRGFFEPQGGGGGGGNSRVMTGRGTYQGPPRGAGPGQPHQGVPSGAPPAGPSGSPDDKWKGRPV